MAYTDFLPGKNIIVAVDIALNKTGIAVMTDEMSVLYGDVLEINQKLEYYEKIARIFSHFSAMFDLIYSFKPQSVALVLEGRLKRGFSPQVLASIEGARIAAYLAFHLTHEKYEGNENGSVSTYSPDIVKKFFTGKANATKNEMLKSASSRISSIGKIRFQEDIYDAIYLGIYHIYTGKGRPQRASVRRDKK